jgi:chloramphenicol-sensitive protein RarD
LNQTGQHGSQAGLLYGVAAYGLWGLIPLYFKAVRHVAPAEILAHRALWSFVVLAVLVRLLGRWGELWRELGSRKLLVMLGLSTLFIAANWLVFIYAVATGQVLQSSLGYFINPLVNVLLGTTFLRERLRPWQVVSVALAAAGVVVLVGLAGEVPWIALSLALTFALYGLMRKIMPVDGLVSLTVETLAMTPVALAYLGYLAATAKFTGVGLGTLGLLMLSGPVTTVPLLFFGGAARRLRLSTMGVLQYLVPTLQFLLAVLVFREPFSTAQLASFACIWLAIGVYTADSFRAVRQARLDVVEPFGADP